MKSFKEFSEEQAVPMVPMTQQPDQAQPDQAQPEDLQMNQAIAGKTQQLLGMLKTRPAQWIQQYRDHINREIQSLQTEKGWGQQAANRSYRDAGMIRKDV